MISMTSYIQKRILEAEKASYRLWLRICLLCWWVSLVKGRAFLTSDRVLVENHTGNGAVRVVLGGLLAALAGVAVLIGGLLSVAMLLIGLPMLPLMALFLHLSTKRKLAKSLRDFEAKVAAARAGVKS